MSGSSHAPPPRRSSAQTSASSTPVSRSSSSNSAQSSSGTGWKGRMSAWGKVAVDKGTILSDKVGVKVNGISEKYGSERFWPVTGDFAVELDKCARILRAFTVNASEETVEEKSATGMKVQKKVIKRIPQKVVREAKGLAIFTSMRTGIAPFGGAGGSGVVLAKLPDGSWSAPASMSPNNLSAGFMIGVDIYDAVLIIRTQQALDSFYGHKVTLGSEIGVAAGPYGSGAALEVGTEKSAVFSYVRSRGAYAGVEGVAQVFVERKEENELLYHWPGIRAEDILKGKVTVPREAALLMRALKEAEGSRELVERPTVPSSSPPNLPGRPSISSPSTSDPFPPPYPVESHVEEVSSVSSPPVETVEERPTLLERPSMLNPGTSDPAPPQSHDSDFNETSTTAPSPELVSEGYPVDEKKRRDSHGEV
ncbi:SH3 domain-containing YSC84-like protein 1, partial [Phenoliferia sp. Uapishka_3]